MNGIESTDQTAGALTDPIDVEVERPARRESEPAATFSLSQVAPGIPTGRTLAEPLLGEPGNPFHEAFRSLRFALEQARERAGVRTVAVTSAERGEGKSVVAVNLALALTEGGRRRVALLDACFGSGSVARLLGAEAPVGLAEALAGTIAPERAMFASPRPGLYALSAGSTLARGIDPLDTVETFGALCNRLATVFDFVLVDTPALLDRVDAAALAARLDGAILVVRAGKTRAQAVDQAVARLGEKRVLGLVMNQG